jgi:hypothetical protein
MGVVATRAGDFARASQLIGSTLDVLRKSPGEQSLDYATALLALGLADAGLGDRASARSRYEASLAIQDGLAAPTAELRLRTLDSLAKVRCELGSVDEARQTAELALAALDRAAPGRDNKDLQKWITTFEGLIAKCGGGKRE